MASELAANFVASALIALIATVIGVTIYLIQKIIKHKILLEERQRSQIKEIAQVKLENIQEVAASQLAILSNFNENVLSQAQQSFICAIGASAIGFIFFIAAIIALLIRSSQSISDASIISGAIVSTISGIFFYLYGRTTSQFSKFHKRLDNILHFLLANSICESLTGNNRENTRIEIIRMIASSAINQSKEKEEKTN